MTNELKHHGIKGQKWGLRRYQNEDGSLTEAGKSRYFEDLGATYRKDFAKRDAEITNSKKYSRDEKRRLRAINKKAYIKNVAETSYNDISRGSKRVKTLSKVGTLAGLGALLGGRILLAKAKSSGNIGNGLQTEQGKKYVNGSLALNKLGSALLTSSAVAYYTAKTKMFVEHCIKLNADKEYRDQKLGTNLKVLRRHGKRKEGAGYNRV